MSKQTQKPSGLSEAMRDKRPRALRYLKDLQGRSPLSIVLAASVAAVGLVGVNLPVAAEATPVNTAVVYPLMSPRVSSKYGTRHHPVRRQVRHHNGIDLAAPRGAPIRSVGEGTVVFSDTYKGYGKMVVVLHGDGVTTHYGHCDELLVEIGQRVRAGEIIARVGSTGLSTGPHLHFEVRQNGKHLNPERFLPEFGVRAEG